MIQSKVEVVYNFTSDTSIAVITELSNFRTNIPAVFYKQPHYIASLEMPILRNRMTSAMLMFRST
jgi:hypothetical protein